jgi:site-specific recombinase XerD
MQPTATDTRWEVFFYDLDRAWPDFKDPLARCFTDLSAWIRSHDGVSGQPFLLGPNGHPDLRVNAFFGSPRMRALDPDTWRKYGYALGVWLNFLETRRVSWDQATPEDLEAFKVWRLADDRNPARVKTGTFAKGSLAALRAFYGWAAATYKVTSPILTREVQVRGRYGLEPAEQAEVMPSGIREQDVKWLDPAGYRRWRDVGLRGFGLDGLEDPTWRGRNEQRDAAFADGLYETGLRLQAWASVLDLELPADDPTRGYATRWLAAACAKGKVVRRYWLPRVALTEVLSYGEGERALAVHRAQRKGRYERLHSVRVVERVYADGRLKLRKAGGEEETVSLDELTPEASRSRAPDRRPVRVNSSPDEPRPGRRAPGPRARRRRASPCRLPDRRRAPLLGLPAGHRPGSPHAGGPCRHHLDELPREGGSVQERARPEPGARS